MNGELTILSMKPAQEKGKFPDNPFIIRKSIEERVGCIEDARPEARGSRYILKVRQSKQIEALLKLQKLLDGTEVIVNFHETLNIRKCTVSCPIGLNMTDDAILEELRVQRVIEVKRFNRKDPDNINKVIPTSTLRITIQGTLIPEYLFFGYLRIKTRPYYPSPLQCENCHRYAHTKRNCQANTICPRCSNEHELDSPCPAKALCVNCKGSHSARARECPMKIVENKIVRIKVDEDVSYIEARKRFEARHQKSIQNRLETVRVAELTKQLESKEEEIMKLRTLLEKLIQEVADLKQNKQIPTITSNVAADTRKLDLTRTSSYENETDISDVMEVENRQDTRSTKRRISNSNPTSPTMNRKDPPKKQALENDLDTSNLKSPIPLEAESLEYKRSIRISSNQEKVSKGKR